jgi:hypothetical protein
MEKENDGNETAFVASMDGLKKRVKLTHLSHHRGGEREKKGRREAKKGRREGLTHKDYFERQREESLSLTSRERSIKRPTKHRLVVIDLIKVRSV